MNILIADDHQFVIADIKDELSRIVPNAKCTGTNDSAEVLKLCGKNNYDVVFMDIDMPGTNGIMLAKTILEKSPRTNIIYVTGYEQYALESYETWASAFLMKPVSTEKLRDAMEHLRYPVSDITDDMLESEYSGNAVIGRKIEKCREEVNMSRNELSKAMGVSLRTVYRWENGERVPDMVTYMKLAKVLGVTMDKILPSDK